MPRHCSLGRSSVGMTARGPLFPETPLRQLQAPPQSPAASPLDLLLPLFRAEPQSSRSPCAGAAPFAPRSTPLRAPADPQQRMQLHRAAAPWPDAQLPPCAAQRASARHRAPPRLHRQSPQPRPNPSTALSRFAPFALWSSPVFSPRCAFKRTHRVGSTGRRRPATAESIHASSAGAVRACCAASPMPAPALSAFPPAQ